MYIIKLVLLLGVLGTSSCIGLVISRKYVKRLQILKNMKTALNIFQVKISFSCDTIPEIFEEIAEKIKGDVGKIFSNAVSNMQEMRPNEAWEQAIIDNSEYLKKDDIDCLAQLRKVAWQD